MSEEKISRDRMMRAMVLFYEFGRGRPGYTLPRHVKHERSWSGWSPAELDQLYYDMIREYGWEADLEPEAPAP